MNIEEAMRELVLGVIEDATEIAEKVQSNLDLSALAEDLMQEVSDRDLADRVKDELDYEDRISALEDIDIDDLKSDVDTLTSDVEELKSLMPEAGFSREDLEGELNTFSNLSPDSRCSLGRAFAAAVRQSLTTDTELQVDFADTLVDNHPWFAMMSDRLAKVESEKPAGPLEAPPVTFGLLWGRHELANTSIFRRVVTGFATAEAASAWRIANAPNSDDWTIVAAVDFSRL